MANPTFKRISCDSVNGPNNYDLCLFVDYSDKSDDILLLNKVYGETIFEGHMYKEETSVCIVLKDDSDPDDMEVKVISLTLLIK